MSELNTARDIIEIQYNGHMGFARLSQAFRANIANEALPVNQLRLPFSRYLLQI